MFLSTSSNKDLLHFVKLSLYNIIRNQNYPNSFPRDIEWLRVHAFELYVNFLWTEECDMFQNFYLYKLIDICTRWKKLFFFFWTTCFLVRHDCVFCRYVTYLVYCPLFTKSKSKIQSLWIRVSYLCN